MIRWAKEAGWPLRGGARLLAGGLLALVLPAAASLAQDTVSARNAPAKMPPQSAGLENFEGPRSVAPLARALAKAVVNISAAPARKKEKAEARPKGEETDPFKFFERRRKQVPPGHPPRRRASLGSGFIIDARGIIVTNNHVIENADDIFVVLQDGTRLKATVRGRDPKTDIAVLAVKPKKPLPHVVFGDSSVVEVGDWVLAIGNPFGLGGSVTIGIVSARNRDINAGPYDDFIQTDAAINKGNSGGPLFDMKGRVIGVNSAILSPSGGSVGIGFAIPANLAKKVVAQLVEFGETRRGWLGVRIQTITEELAEGLGLGKPEGALVAEVTPGGPAERAGLKPRDVIVSFNGVPVRKMRELPRVVAETPVGARVPVVVIRNGERLALTVELGRLEDADRLKVAREKAAGKNGERAPRALLLGMELTPLTPSLRKEHKVPSAISGGLLVLKVTANSAAAEKGIMAGDIIAEAAGHSLERPRDLEQAIARVRGQGRGAMPLLVLRKAEDYKPLYVALRIGARDRQGR